MANVCVFEFGEGLAIKGQDRILWVMYPNCVGGYKNPNKCLNPSLLKRSVLLCINLKSQTNSKQLLNIYVMFKTKQKVLN